MITRTKDPAHAATCRIPSTPPTPKPGSAGFGYKTRGAAHYRQNKPPRRRTCAIRPGRTGARVQPRPAWCRALARRAGTREPSAAEAQALAITEPLYARHVLHRPPPQLALLEAPEPWPWPGRPCCRTDRHGHRHRPPGRRRFPCNMTVKQLGERARANAVRLRVPGRPPGRRGPLRRRRTPAARDPAHARPAPGHLRLAAADVPRRPGLRPVPPRRAGLPPVDGARRLPARRTRARARPVPLAESRPAQLRPVPADEDPLPATGGRSRRARAAAGPVAPGLVAAAHPERDDEGRAATGDP